MTAVASVGEEALLVGPAEEPLSDDLIRALAYRTTVTRRLGADQFAQDHVVRMFPATSRRKMAAFKRWRIWQGQISPFVKEKIDDIYDTERIRESVKRHVNNAYNPARDIVTAVCQVYKQAPKRTVRKAGKRKLEALHRLYLRSKLDRMAAQLNRIAYFVGPTLVLPRVGKKRAGFEIILPHDYDVVLDEDNPHGPPAAVAFRSPKKGTDMCVIDGSGKRYFKFGAGHDDLGLGPVDELHDLHEPAKEHKPYAIFRLDCPIDIYDWHSAMLHERIVDVSIDVNVVWAQMGHVRKSQNKRLLRAQGNLSQLPKGQNAADPEGALMAPAINNAPIEVDTLDFNTSPETFIMNIRMLYETAAESTGVQIVSLTSQNGSAIDIEFAFDGLTEIRNAMVPHCRDGEKDLALAMVQAAIESGYDERSQLPTLEEIETGFRVDFCKLSRRFDDPSKEIEYKDWEIKYGLESPLGLLRTRHPEASDEELQEIQDENLEITSKWNDEITKRNMASPDGSGAITTAAQANGAMGPRVKNSVGSNGKPKPEA